MAFMKDILTRKHISYLIQLKKDIPKTENVQKIRICILQLPALVLANRFKGSGFNLLNYKVVPLLEYYYS